VLAILLVVLIVLLIKAPKVAAWLIGGLACLAIIGGLFLPLSHRSVKNVETYYETAVADDTAPLEPAAMSPVWSEGIDNTFDADVYPSKLAAVRALGARMREPLQEAVAYLDGSAEIIVFQEEHDRSLITEFREAIRQALPEVTCSIAAGTRNIDFNEIAITLRFADPTPFMPQPPQSEQSNGRHTARHNVVANARTRDWEATAREDFIEKPWVENFAAFASERPQEHYFVARSREACTSENEAKQQAMADAANQLGQKIGKTWHIPGGSEFLMVGSQEVQQGGFIVDQFVQSFDGSAGRIWRHALLIDASARKLEWLDTRMSRVAGSVRASWVRTIASALGVLLVIVVTYFFLNMATRGYYDWSLRIAGVVLAIVGVIVIFLMS
jgi:hypothetical protein